MKKFKQIDFIISMTLMTSFVLLAFIRRDGSIMLGYFVVGGWQVASMIVHEINKWFVPAGGRRRVYHYVVLGVIIAALLGAMLPALLMLVAYLMLFAAPFMAIFYTYLCYNETYVKLKRPLAALK